MLNRTPEGKFCDRASLLHHWLPTLLTEVWFNPVPKMLDRAAEWCRVEAADTLQRGGSVLKGAASGTWIPTAHLRDYERHIATANVLREAAERVREIWK